MPPATGDGNGRHWSFSRGLRSWRSFTFFPKHHIVTLGLAAGLLWLSRPGLPDVERASIWQALALTLMGAAAPVCNTPPMAAVVLPYFFLLRHLAAPAS
jgi:hypothetical protein